MRTMKKLLLNNIIKFYFAIIKRKEEKYMEKDIKKQIFTIAYAVALIAVVVGAVQLLYNAITMFVYFNGSPSYHGKFQLPIAIVVLLAAFFAIAFEVLEIKSICTKTDETKKKLFIVNTVFTSMVALAMIVCKIIFMTYRKYQFGQLPHGVYDGDTQFALYQGVISIFITQLVYMIIITIMHIAKIISDKKKNKNTKGVVELETTPNENNTK